MMSYRNPFTRVLANQVMLGCVGVPSTIGGLGTLGRISEGDRPLLYVPDLAPVGSGTAPQSQGGYFPRSVDDDAVALNVLGFQAGFPGGGVSQASDMANADGAWDATFRGAVTAFQQRNPASGKSDGWIGPDTRRALAVAVARFNIENPPSVPKIPPGLPAPGGGSSPAPGKVVPPGGATPVVDKSDDDETLMYVGIGAGALALLGLGWYAFSR